MIPYWRNEENNELYTESRTLVDRCLTLKNIPQVLERFLESSLKGMFTRSNISPNTYPTLVLGEMLDRLNSMLGQQPLTFLMLGEV